jgi:hypothetical protein
MPRRCYAELLGGCDKLSREHYISESVLLDISGGKNIWLQGSKRTPEAWLSPSALTAKVLCRHHNSALSRLDASAATVISNLRRYQTSLDNGEEPGSSSVAVDGSHFELWLLKVAFGLLASDQMRPPTSTAGPARMRRHDDTLRVLFGLRPWPRNWGMYFNATVDEQFKAPTLNDGSMSEFGVEPQWAQSELWALNVWIRSLPLKLCLGRPDNLPPEFFRPSALTLRSQSGHSALTLDLAWGDDGMEHQPVSMDRVGP